MARTRLIDVPFAAGQNESVDPKLLPAGYLTRAKNVRLRKDGRWGVRYGDTALALTSNMTLSLRPADLISFDDRLFSPGDANFAASLPAVDVYELVEQAQFAWAATDPDTFNLRMVSVTGVRDLGRPPSQTVSITTMDVAAANGLVCMVFETSSESTIHVFRADTDATVLLAQKAITRPRVIAIGDTFFIGGIDGTTIDLYSYDPSTDETLQTETDIFAAGDAITHWDFETNGDDDGAWAVVHRSTPATSIKELNAAGAVILTFAGPATAFNFVSICQTATRVHLAVVATSDNEVDLYSYTLAGALSTGPTTIDAGFTTNAQVAVADLTATGAGAETIGIFLQSSGSPAAFDIMQRTKNATTHATIGTRLYNQSRLTAKAIMEPYAILTIPVFGTVQSTGSFATNNLIQGFLVAPHVIAASKDRFEAGFPALAHLPRIGRDLVSGKGYWPNFVVDKDGKQSPIVTEFDFTSASRRQTVDMGGLLYIFGGSPQLHDTRRLVEAGYQEDPVLYSVTPSNGAGSLPSSTTLNVAAIWRWTDSRGFLHESALSEVAVVTMGASDDTIALSVSSPHSLRNNIDGSVTGSSVEIVVFRSTAGKKQLRRAASQVIVASGGAVAFTLTASDATIATAGVVYTQGGRGALGDILEHESPLPADYACRHGKRILSAGCPNPFVAQVSKPEFPGEPINWSGDEAFLLRCPDRIRGVASQDLIGYLFSRRAVFAFTGDGPDDTGQGTYSDPAELPASIGLHSANSIAVTPVGVMYQADEEKLFIIPRGGGEPIWFGQAIRSTLKAFPVVTASAVLPQEQLVTFACNNTGGTDGRLIHYDLRASTWIVDEFDGSTPITAIAEFDGRLARLSESVITLANETHPPAAFIDHSLITGTLRPFGENAWGRLCSVTLLGEFRGNCILTLLISYNDGEDFTTLGTTYSLSTADGLVAGDAIRRQWWPARQKGDRFMLEFRVTALAGAATEGFVFNAYTIEVAGAKGATRLGATKRG